MRSVCLFIRCILFVMACLFLPLQGHAQQSPVATNVRNFPIQNIAGMTQILPLTGYDNDGTIVSFTITQRPPNGMGRLYLNGSQVNVGQVVPLADAGKLKFDVNSTATGEATFQFRATDNSGLTSAVATYTIPIVAPNSSGTSICQADNLSTNILGAEGTFSAGYITPNATISCVNNGGTVASPTGNLGNAQPSLTSYVYAPASLGPEGTYAFLKTMGTMATRNCIKTDWVVSDHTGDGGYAMIVNGSPDVDEFGATFYQKTSLTVCPNTLYEFSAWVMNVLPGNHSAAGAGSEPNISFFINNNKVATSGPIAYSTAATNWEPQWVKVGGLWYSGDNTSVNLRIDNATFVAGGNDLALDDISMAICGLSINYPNVDLNPKFCTYGTLPLNANISSSINTYSYYIFQQSTDGGNNWTDLGVPKQGSPVWNNSTSQYEYLATYGDIPINASMNGFMYRVKVATNFANLNGTTCNVNASKIITVIAFDQTVAGADIVSCAGITTYKLEAAKTGETWQALAGNPAAASIDQAGNVSGMTVNGIYRFELSNLAGCTDTVEIRRDQAGNAGSNVTVCSSVSSYKLADAGTGYAWEAGPSNPQAATVNAATGQVAGMTAAGVYTFILRSAYSNCVDEVSITVAAPLTAGIAKTDISCFAATNGSIDLSPAGGTAPYTFAWNTGATTEDISGLAPGNYSVTVTDANNCTTIQNITITEPSQLTAGFTKTDVNCFGALTGSINLNVSGGTTPYTFAWNTGATTEDLNGLAAGAYSVTVTDANGCTVTQNVTITEPTQLTASFSKVDVNCFGASTGSINLSVSGGTAPYTFAWNTGVTTEDLTALAAGAYSVTVTDANSCTVIQNVTITEPAQLTANFSKTDVGCFGTSTGSINLSVNGGTAPYSFAWNTGATTEDLSSLVAGAYSVTVTDANSCTTIQNITIAEPTQLVAGFTKTDVSCFSASTGSINLSISGGTAPYTYAWSNSATTEDLSGLVAGAYSVTVTDANGCSVTQNITIAEPAQLIASFSKVDVNCFGASTGGVNLSVSGGTAPYSFAWNTGASTEDLNGLAAGNYSVTVTDANGCSVIQNVTISEPTQLTASFTKNDVACFGASTGSINLSISGGTAPYTFAWNTGATTEDLSTLTAGNYLVTVIDANGCSVTQNVTITEPAQLTAGFTKTDVNCFGASTGSINLSISGGTAPYTFAWNTGATTEDLSGLAAGNYSVTVTDASGCAATQNVTITEPAQLTASFTKTDVGCFGASTGSINLSVSGGTAPYTFTWNTGASTEDLSGLAAGNYSVTVTDANGCSVTQNVTITEPTQLTASFTKTDVNCFGASTGNINLSVSGGAAPYAFAWNTGATTEDLSSLAAGNYSVTVTDANGCSVIQNVTISEPTQLTASFTKNDVACFGASTGSINLSVSGGTAPYTFAWNTGAMTEDVSSLAAGTYSVTVTDANGCSVTQNVTITEPVQLTASFTKTDVSCFGTSTGSINLSISGGTAPYSFAWNTGSTTEDLSSLTAGAYSVTVTDANGCSVAQNVTITEPPQLTASFTKVDVNCFGASTGNINLSVSGGTAPYSFAWNTGATTENLSSLAAGNYSVTVTDANGCSVTQNVTITEPLQLTASFTKTDVGCFGTSNGSINLSISGGTAPYSFAWNTGATTEDLSNLVAGNYSVTITDANGCTTTQNITITEPAQLAASFTKADVNCFGASTGSINLSVNGGTAPYTFTWNTGATTEDLSNLAAGNYSVTVTDANGCSVTQNVIITEPTQLTASFTKEDVKCFGASTGSINLSVSGGTAPYTFAWNNGTTTEDLNTLVAGNYSVIITDANGCTATQNVAIAEPTQLIAGFTKVDIGCFGASTGSINLSVSGGTSPYSFAWNTGATTEDLNNLVAGNYLVTVTDANGCSVTQNVTITEPVQLIASFTKNDVACFGASTGSINLSVNGGTAPYTFTWNTGATTEDLSGLAAGNYSVTVTDANGCTVTQNVTITEPTQLTASFTKTDVGCFGTSTGRINLSVSGDTAPYSFAWNTGATTKDLSSLAAGNYSVTITDANGCTTTQNVTITEPAQLTATFSKTDVNCFGTSTGSINLSVSGGTAPYAFAWNTGVTAEDLSGLGAGTYSVTVTDANGCSVTQNVSITEPAQLAASFTKVDVNCFGASTGSINLSVSGGTTPYTFAWNTGATTEDLNGLAAGAYSVTVTDANGCTVTQNVTITEPTQLTASFSKVDVNCFGASTGSINLSVSGGTAPYVFAWNTGAITEDLTALAAGAYSVTVTDANGCTVTQNITITEPAQLTSSFTKTDISCFGTSTGSINLSVSGGIPPYSFAWNTGAITEDLSNLAAGNYSVIVTDANGCTTTQNVTISEPALLAATFSKTDVNCFGASTGNINLNISGGTAPYSFTWNTGAITEDVSNLAAGNYSVTVTDANGCTTSQNITITEPAQLTATLSKTDVNCFGTSTGSINLSVSGGTAPYAFAWNTGVITEDLTALAAGAYSVTVTDANGCSVTQNVTITEPVQLIASFTKNDVACFGASTGSINLSVSGGTSLYSFAWNTGATTKDLSGLAAGAYSVTVTDANGCTVTQNVTITEPAQLTASFTKNDVACFGASTGGINLSVNGGTAPYTFAWNTGASTEDLNGLAAGNYSVTVTDANGCTTIQSVTITEPAQLTSSFVKTDVGCFGTSTGNINLSVSGGTAPYSFAWNTGASTEDINNLSTGLYSVTVTDANGCATTQSITITEPAQLIATFSKTDVGCFGVSTGSINISVSGGTAPYSFTWSTGAITEDLNGLAAGAYFITVTDANGCTATQNVTITEPAQLTSSFTKTDVGCFGASTGSINLSVSGGTAPYTFAWNTGAMTEDVSSLAAGTYSVTVTDANGCSVTQNVTITEPAQLAASFTKVDVNCFGASTGSINLSVSGGTAPYTFAWNTGATTEDLSGLVAGNYSVTVTDANGCPVTQNVTITEPVQLTASFTKTDVGCFGASTGSINLSISGGTAPYTVAWSTGAITEDLSTLAAGNYSVTVTDANGCLLTQNVTITEPTQLTSSFSKTDVNCFGASTGSINLSVSGGTAPYTFAWNTGAMTEDVSSLAAGTYSVTVTDANGCTVIQNVTVTEPAQLAASFTKTDVNCFGASTGDINLNVSGGTAPYTFAWNTGATTEDLSGLAAGNYSLTITDKNGCVIAQNVTITEPTQLTASFNKTDVKCFGASTGSINLSVNGGRSPYVFAWNTGAATEDLNNLAAGNYSVTVTDANGCTTVQNVTITEPTLLTASPGKTDVNCSGASTGSINLNVSGGTAPYTFNWSNGATTKDLNGLFAGTYSVTVTDANGCTVTQNVTITEPAQLITSFTKTDINCFGVLTGSINLNISGGRAPYAFAWNTGATTEDINGLAAGAYSVTITDANGCTATQNITITEPAQLAVSFTKTDVGCFGTSTGSINLSVSGGRAPYTFAWNTGTITEDISNLAAGNYSVTVTDANGCAAMQNVTIAEPARLIASFTKTDVGCFGTSTGSIKLSVSGGRAPYSFAWNNGQTAEDINNLVAGSYSVTVTDANGCFIAQSVQILQPAALAVSFVKKDNICFGASAGSIDLSISGGKAPYRFVWSNGDSTEDITDLSAGNYSVTITDANNCSTTQSITISQPDAMQIAFTKVDNTCFGSAAGSINLSVSGGAAPYTFAWSNGAKTRNLASLAAGNYSVTVTDSRGCAVTQDIIINQAQKLTAQVIAQNAYCTNNNGSVRVMVSGGVPPYKYAWKHAAQVNSNLVTDLKPGNYEVSITDAAGCSVTYNASIAAEQCNTETETPASLVYLTPELSSVREGMRTTVTARLSKAFPEDVSIMIQYAGTATPRADYALTDQYQTLTIRKGELTTSDVITIIAVGDAVQEEEEHILLRIASVSNSNVQIGSGARVNITDVYPPIPDGTDGSPNPQPVNRDLIIDPLISPNDDGAGNDAFIIQNITSYTDNEVIIFNRWGNEVFRIKGYDNSTRVFKGYANTGMLANTSQPLPDGVYYYLIYTNVGSGSGMQRNLNKGYIILKR